MKKVYLKGPKGETGEAAEAGVQDVEEFDPVEVALEKPLEDSLPIANAVEEVDPDGNSSKKNE